MATRSKGQLSAHQVVLLARAVSRRDMESVALGYLGVDEEVIVSLKDSRRDDMDGFNRDIIKNWANRNPGDNQVQTLASILYQAARECSYLNPQKIREILGVSEEDASAVQKQGTSSTCPTEEDLLKLGEDLKPYTEDLTGIGVVPWIKSCVVNMKDLYTKLKVVKRDSKPRGPQKIGIDDYRQFFEENSESSESDQCEQDTGEHDEGAPTPKKMRVCKRKGKRILIKGRPGIGKTTFAKKVAYDWVKGVFTAVSIVLFVFLKLVKPGDTIENVIIQQNPWMEGLGVTEQRIRAILETFGSKCLLILDGLDEHALGTNTDVFRIIRGQKFLHCNVLVTSRPHTTEEIIEHVQIIAVVEGFTREHARQFVSKMLSDERKVEAVLRFDPYGNEEGDVQENHEWDSDDDSREDDTDDDADDERLYNYPILLSFLCTLVQNDQIDLGSNKVSFGEVFGRIVRCLYVKYTRRKGIEFSLLEFVQILKNIGRLALKTLLSGKPLLTRSEVIRDVGEEAFEYGLLIGHEDYRLIRDETADIFITFPHRTIHEFLGAFYFILMLNEGETIESLIGSNCKNPIFLKNPLFLQFCAWFIFDAQEILGLQDMQRSCNILANAVLKRINFAKLELRDIADIYPALDVADAFRRKEASTLKFFAKVLSECKLTKELLLEDVESASWVLTAMNPILGSLESITIDERSYFIPLSSVDDLSLVFDASDVSHKLIKDVLAKSSTTGKNISVYIIKGYSSRSNVTVELSELLTKEVKELHIILKQNVSIKTVLGSQICPNLTQLSLSNLNRDSAFSLQKALRSGCLPNLSHLSLLGYCSRLEDMIQDALSSHSNLRHLNLCCGDWNLDNLSLLSDRLTSLALYCPGNTASNRSLPTELTGHWSKLTTFKLNTTSRAIYSLPSPLRGNIEKTNVNDRARAILTKIKPGKLSALRTLVVHQSIGSPADLQSLSTGLEQWSLSKLDISGSSGVTGNLSVLLRHSFPSLNSLILSDCGLNSEDLCSLAQASVEGRLPELKHLDVSQNILLDIVNLFACECQWNQLLSLVVSLPHLNFGFLANKLEMGYLSSLEELRLWVPHSQCGLFSDDVIWKRLHRIDVVLMTYNCDAACVFGSIAATCRKGRLPALRTVCLLTDLMDAPMEGDAEIRELMKCNVRVYTCCLEEEEFLNNAGFA